MKIAVIGSGKMARVRAAALLAQGGNLCCVASKRLARAEAFAQEFGIPHFTDVYQEVLSFAPDAVLIEVPHSVQDSIAIWALQVGLHALIGGCLATNTQTAHEISRLTRVHSLVVEAGYEARYQAVWQRAKEHFDANDIGKVIAVRSLAIFPADPSSWYYREDESCGMVLTHMTYAFINPIRWLFGPPKHISAYGSRKAQTEEGFVRHETCTVNFLFADNVVCNMTATYAAVPVGDAWSVSILGTQGRIDVMPGDGKPSALRIWIRDRQAEVLEITEDQPFERQALAFLSAPSEPNRCLNPPWDATLDVQIAEIIVRSIEEGTALPFAPEQAVET